MFSSYLGQSLLKLAIERRLVDVRAARHSRLGPRQASDSVGRSPLTAAGRAWCSRSTGRRVRGGGARRCGRAGPPGHADAAWSPAGSSRGGGLAGHAAAADPLCGRYEGFDERMRQILEPRRDFDRRLRLGGGEVAAMVVDRRRGPVDARRSGGRGEQPAGLVFRPESAARIFRSTPGPANSAA